MDLDNAALAKMDIMHADVDITEFGFELPSFSDIEELKLSQLAKQIKNKRKPHLYWKILYAPTVAAVQAIEFRRKLRKEPNFKLPAIMCSSSYTTKQIVHLANGGIHEDIPQADFSYLVSPSFDRRQIHNPAQWCAKNNLINLSPKSKSDRHGSSLRFSITPRGVWVYDYLRKDLKHLQQLYAASGASLHLVLPHPNAPTTRKDDESDENPGDQ